MMLSRLFAPLAMKVAGGIIVGLLILAVTLAITVKSVNRKNADLTSERDALSAQLDAANRNLAAHETASIERAADTSRIAAAQKELTDAIQAVPDSLPDPVAVAVGCRELRGAGYLDADLPAACRSASGSQARALP